MGERLRDAYWTARTAGLNLDAVALCLRHRCKPEQGEVGFGWGRFAWPDNDLERKLWQATVRAHRWAYTAKAVACLILGRTSTDRKAADWWRESLVIVATDNGHSWSSVDGTFYDWDEIVTLAGWGRGTWAAWQQTEGS